MTVKTRFTGALVVVGLISVPTLTQAQDQPGPAEDRNIRLSLGAGVTAGAIDGKPAINGSIGYRFARLFSFDVEVMGALGAADRFGHRMFDLGNDLGPAVGRVGELMGRHRGSSLALLPGAASSLAPLRIPTTTDGSTLLSTAGVRFLIPARSDRFQPYVSGGLGVARTEETLRISYGTLLGLPGRPAGLPASGLEFEQSTSHVGIAGSAGVGASVRVFRAMSLDIDARYYRLDRGRNLGTFGGGVSYRF